MTAQQPDAGLILTKTLEFVREARAAILERSSKGFSIDIKSDRSFVTEADLEAEKILRARIGQNFPDHGIVGEEMENTNPSSPYQWYIDPIDGTRNFANNIPTYGTIVGLHHNGKPIAGVIDHPALNLLYYGATGQGAYCNGQRLTIHDRSAGQTRTSAVGLDENEIVLISTRGMFDRSGETALFDKFLQQHPTVYIYYDVFSTTRAVQGSVGALVEFNVKMWDCSASQLLIEEAGGRFEYIRERKNPGGPTSYSMVFGKPSVVETLLKFFG
jgi:histidinol-phosphatase